MKHITTFADFLNEGINVKDIKVGTILNFKDGETWKVTKTPGISSNSKIVFASPYGDTKKNYVSLPIEFSIDKLEKDVKSLSESVVNEENINIKNISDIEHTRLIKWIGQNLNSDVDVVKSKDGFAIDASKIPSRDKNDLIKYLKSSDYLNEAYTNEASAFMAKDVAKTVAFLNAEAGPEPGYLFFGHNEDIEDFDKLWKKKKYQEALDMLAQDREIEAQTFDDVKPWVKESKEVSEGFLDKGDGYWALYIANKDTTIGKTVVPKGTVIGSVGGGNWESTDGKINTHIGALLDTPDFDKVQNPVWPIVTDFTKEVENWARQTRDLIQRDPSKAQAVINNRTRVIADMRKLLK